VSDVAFIALTIAVFAVMAVVVRGVERLVGSLAVSEPSDSVGGEQRTEHLAAGQSKSCDIDAVRVGVPADGQVIR